MRAISNKLRYMLLNAGVKFQIWQDTYIAWQGTWFDEKLQYCEIFFFKMLKMGIIENNTTKIQSMYYQKF